MIEWLFSVFHSSRNILLTARTKKMSSPSKADDQKLKSKTMAYILWFFGGAMGMHHYYLGRDMHGFLTWTTFGGYFGIGWISDLFYIGQYVDEANEEPEFQRKVKEKMKKHKKPPFSTYRFTGMIVMGYFWMCIFQLALPEEEFYGINWKWLYNLSPIPCCLGIWAVGNVGQQKGGMTTPLVVAFLCLLLKQCMEETTAYTIMVLAAAYVFDSHEKQWKPRTKSSSCCMKRTFFILGGFTIFMAFWLSYAYFNLKITDQDGEEVLFRDALANLWSSSLMADLKQSWADLKTYIKVHGFIATFRQLFELQEPYSEENAYKVLELTSTASQADINARCRSLSVKYHPDKVKDEEKKRVAQEKFYEIQQACELLSSNRSKRRRKNKRYTPDTHDL